MREPPTELPKFCKSEVEAKASAGFRAWVPALRRSGKGWTQYLLVA